MSELPFVHAKACPDCGGKMRLRTPKPDGKQFEPFYGCENFRDGCRTTFNIPGAGGDSEPRPAPRQGGQRAPQTPQEWWDKVLESNRVSKVPCPNCGCVIIVDVHASALPPILPTDTERRDKADDSHTQAELPPAPKPQHKPTGGYNRY